MRRVAELGGVVVDGPRQPLDDEGLPAELGAPDAHRGRPGAAGHGEPPRLRLPPRGRPLGAMGRTLTDVALPEAPPRGQRERRRERGQHQRRQPAAKVSTGIAGQMGVRREPGDPAGQLEQLAELVRPRRTAASSAPAAGRVAAAERRRAAGPAPATRQTAGACASAAPTNRPSASSPLPAWMPEADSGRHAGDHERAARWPRPGRRRRSRRRSASVTWRWPAPARCGRRARRRPRGRRPRSRSR